MVPDLILQATPREVKDMGKVFDNCHWPQRRKSSNIGGLQKRGLLSAESIKVEETLMTSFDRDQVEGQHYQVSAGPLDLSFLGDLPSDPEPFAAGRQIPWNDPEFSRRMLAVHLDESHDWASRRAEKRVRIVDELQRLTDLSPGDRVLDVGCGPGLYCQEWARRGMRVQGWDYAPAAIEHARRQAGEAGLKIEYVRDDYRNLQAEGHFDLVTLIFGDLNVFSMTDAEALLARVRGVLRPGGYFFADVTTPQFYPEQEMRQSFGYHEAGLWSDAPYLELHESHPVRADNLRWQRYVIVEAHSGRARVFTTWSQEYTPDTIAALLERAGLSLRAIYDDPDVSPLCDQRGWLGVLAVKG
jgi:2-polyprenyl-3-methyl-5-hydroxy-6-metoxy-1,4-benzoquinol methylase